MGIVWGCIIISCSGSVPLTINLSKNIVFILNFHDAIQLKIKNGEIAPFIKIF